MYTTRPRAGPARPGPVAAAVATAVLAAVVSGGCGSPHRAAPAAMPTASAARPSARAGGGAPAAPATTRLAAVAFASPQSGYGAFLRQSGAACHDLVGRTADGGAAFGQLTPVTSWPCAGYPPASSLAADRQGDVFLYGPRLLVSHDGGRHWAASRQPGTVLAIAPSGRSVWMVRADCTRSARSCPLRLLESANGGRSWAQPPLEPPGASVRAAVGTAPRQGAAGQTWLVRTGRSSAYLLSSPAPGGNAPLWFTANAGASWSARRISCGLSALSVTLSAAPDGTLVAVCATEPGAGNQAKSTARSTDGGLFWSTHLACPPRRMVCPGGDLDFGYLGQIDAVSGDAVYLVGPRSSLLVTRDGGIRWRPVRPLLGDTSGGTSQVHFFSPRDGIVVGDDSRDGQETIWHTGDGGAHWSAVVPRTP